MIIRNMFFVKIKNRMSRSRNHAIMLRNNPTFWNIFFNEKDNIPLDYVVYAIITKPYWKFFEEVIYITIVNESIQDSMYVMDVHQKNAKIIDSSIPIEWITREFKKPVRIVSEDGISYIDIKKIQGIPFIVNNIHIFNEHLNSFDLAVEIMRECQENCILP